MNGTNVLFICLTKEAKVHVGQEKAHCIPMMKDKSSAKYLPWLPNMNALNITFMKHAMSCTDKTMMIIILSK